MIYDRDHWKAMLPYVQAFAEGKEIEVLTNNTRYGWLTVEQATFNDRPEAYRIKPEKRVIKAWVAIYDDKCGYCHGDKTLVERYCPDATAYKEIEIEFTPGEGKSLLSNQVE